MLQEQSLGKGEKVMSIAKMLNRTMFDIEKIGNFKYVHFWGYLYASEYDNMYCHLEYVGFFVPLSEVLNEGFSAYEENHQEFYNQTIADCDEQQVAMILREKFSEIDEKDINMDIPYGTYILK